MVWPTLGSRKAKEQNRTAPRFSYAPIYCNEVRFEVMLPEYHLTTGEFLSSMSSLGVIHCEYCLGTISVKFSVDVNGWPKYLTP